MIKATPPHQPAGKGQTRLGVAGLAQRIVNHRAAVPMLSGGLIVIPGAIILLLMGRHLLSVNWFQGALFALGIVACVVVCGVAHFRGKKRESQLVASVDPAELRVQQLHRQQMAELPAEFVELRDRLCRGFGGGDAKKWRSKIDNAIFPGVNLKNDVDQWLRWLFTTGAGPLQRALLTAGGGPLQGKLLEPPDIGIPLPGGRRDAHMTPAWYADRVARAAKKTATPAWRANIGFVTTPLVLVGLVYLYFVVHPPLLALAAVTFFVIMIESALLGWSVGTNPGESYAWYTMTQQLVDELHAGTPHVLQADCLDSSCPNNPDVAAA